MFSLKTVEPKFNPKFFIKPFSKQQNFGPDQIQSICRLQINSTKTMISLFGRVENTVGKGGNADYQHLFLFPKWYSKISGYSKL